MRDAWQDVLRRLGAGEPTLTYDDAHRWSQEDFEGLSNIGLLREAELATHLLCDSCPDPHWEEVHWTEDGQRAFIACPEEGTVAVEPERLRRWRIDADRLAALLAGALELAGPVQNLFLGRLWYLGRRRLTGRFRDFFLAVPDHEDVSRTLAEAKRHLTSGSGLLMFPRQPVLEPGWEIARLRHVVLSNVASLNGGRLTVDLDYIEDVLWREGDTSKARKARSLAVPEGATWPEVSIELSDATLRIEIGAFRKELSFEEAGFGERDQRLETLRILAAGRGRLVPDRIASKPLDKTPMKTRVSRLRYHLQELLPIEGDPIPYNRKAGLYVCNFGLRLERQEFLPIPADSSWLDLRFHECRDGRLVVSVPERQTFRARAVGRGHREWVEEVAQQDKAASHTYSLEGLGLRNARGQFTAEGKALVDLLRGQGKLKRRGDDMAVLKLSRWLQEWTGLDGAPLEYSQSTQSWSARFECTSERSE